MAFVFFGVFFLLIELMHNRLQQSFVCVCVCVCVCVVTMSREITPDLSTLTHFA